MRHKRLTPIVNTETHENSRKAVEASKIASKAKCDTIFASSPAELKLVKVYNQYKENAL